MKKVLSILISIVFVALGCSIQAFAADNSGYIIITDTVAADTGADVSAEIQAVIDANPNRTIFFPDGEYTVSSPILTPAEPTKSVSLKLSDFAIIKAAEGWQGGAVIQLGGKSPANDTATNGSNYSLEGGIIDGSGVANGVSVNSGRETAIRNVSIKNTVVGVHVMYGANSGSSDSDITGVNIIGTGKTDSTGILLEGFDNTVTNVRIGNVFTGVKISSAGNMLRNVHPLYYSDYTDYLNSCGFLIESGNNWFDYCYSDQFGIGFRTTGNGENIFNNCFCYWYSAAGETHTAFKADRQFGSTLTNFKADFNSAENNNIVLSVGELGGSGTIDNIRVDDKKVSDFTYLLYSEDGIFIGKTIGFFSFIINFLKEIFN